VRLAFIKLLYRAISAIGSGTSPLTTVHRMAGDPRNMKNAPPAILEAPRNSHASRYPMP
jgi:hypothetical protein